MFAVLLTVQVLLALALIGLVLLQQGKGADMGAAFGSGASGTVFGARGSGSFLTRTTAILAALFFANSILLSTPLVLKANREPTSVTERVAPPAPAEPATDLPPVDVPAVDAPAAELPADAVPEAQAPATEDSTADAPADGVPASDTPAAGAAEPPVE